MYMVDVKNRFGVEQLRNMGCGYAPRSQYWPLKNKNLLSLHKCAKKLFSVGKKLFSVGKKLLFVIHCNLYQLNNVKVKWNKVHNTMYGT